MYLRGVLTFKSCLFTCTWRYALEPEVLRVHHYVELLARDRGRCAALHGACDLPDDVLLRSWANACEHGLSQLCAGEHENLRVTTEAVAPLVGDENQRDTTEADAPLGGGESRRDTTEANAPRVGGEVGGLCSETRGSWCWTGGYTCEVCCFPPPEGNSECWLGDETFTYANCCGGASKHASTLT